MSIAQLARASSIGTTACAEAADAGAVAERLVERAPEQQPGVLDRVVRSRLEVAPSVARRGRAGRGGRARRAGGRRSRRRWCACRAPEPSRFRSSWMSVSPVVRRTCEVLLTRGAPSIRRARESPRRGPALRRRARDGRAPRRARIREPCGAGRWPPTAPTGSARRRRWAARGSSRPRSRRRRWRPPRRRTGSPRARTSGASASARAPTSSRCSGAIAVRHVRPPARPPIGDHLEHGVGHARALRRHPLDRGDHRLAQLARRATAATAGCPGRARPGRAGRARSAPGRASSPSAITNSSLGPGDAVDADLGPGDLLLRLLDPGVAGTGDHVDGPHGVRCRRRAPRSPARHPSR